MSLCFVTCPICKTDNYIIDYSCMQKPVMIECEKEGCENYLIVKEKRMSIELICGKDCTMSTKELNLKYQNFRSSSHSGSVVIMEKERLKIEFMYLVKDMIANALSSHFKTDITVEFGSGVRTWNTHLAIYDALNRNRKVKLKPPQHSQHLYFEGGDLRFFKNGVRMKEEAFLHECFETIDKELGHLIIQMLRYPWGIHIGVMTSRYEYKRVRKN